jgi:hypothetical protein
MSTENLRPPLVVVPIENWSTISEKALRFALRLSPKVIAVHVHSEDHPHNLKETWGPCVEEPARRAGLPVPQLVVLNSPFRFVLNPIINYVLDLERQHPDDKIAVVVPNLVERHWYHRFLHNQRGDLLTALLLLKGNAGIIIINVPWYLND